MEKRYDNLVGKLSNLTPLSLYQIAEVLEEIKNLKLDENEITEMINEIKKIADIEIEIEYHRSLANWHWF